MRPIVAQEINRHSRENSQYQDLLLNLIKYQIRNKGSVLKKVHYLFGYLFLIQKHTLYRDEIRKSK